MAKDVPEVLVLRRSAQTAAHRKRAEMLRLFDQLEFCVRNKVDTAKVLIDLDACRRS